MGSAFSIIKSNSNTNNESSEHLNNDLLMNDTNELSINKDNTVNHRRSNRIFEASKKNITTFQPTKEEQTNKNNHEIKEEIKEEHTNETQEDECNKILDKLEDDGYKKLGELKNNQNIKTSEDLGNALMNIIKDGANEFKNKTGRRMTYAEMRYAYG
jgi:hypothetical protein